MMPPANDTGTCRTEEAALLAAIAADPESDVPRLIYADWLEERGDPVRLAYSEFIRVQCELARSRDDDPRRRQLGNRVIQLLNEHALGWLDPLFPWIIGENRWEFHRGLLTQVGVRAAALQQPHLIQLFRVIPDITVELDIEIPLIVLESVPFYFAYSSNILPLVFWQQTLVVAHSKEDERLYTAGELASILKRPVFAVTASPEAIHHRIEREYVRALQHDEHRSEPIRQAHRILLEAVSQQIGEVHIEPRPEEVRVRYRTRRGFLNRSSFPVEMLPELATCFTELVGIRVHDRQHNQMGSITLRFEQSVIEIHVLVRSTRHGPSVRISLSRKLDEL